MTGLLELHSWNSELVLYRDGRHVRVHSAALDLQCPDARKLSSIDCRLYKRESSCQAATYPLDRLNCRSHSKVAEWQSTYDARQVST